MLKKTGVFFLVIALLLIIIQWIPQNKAVNESVVGKDIIEQEQLTEEMEAILIKACYDCHSQEVIFPWYAKVAPVSWLVNRDINLGRAQLDFSYWADYSKREKLSILDDISTEVYEGSMPMPIYLLMHEESRITADERRLIIQWTETLTEKIFND